MEDPARFYAAWGLDPRDPQSLTDFGTLMANAGQVEEGRLYYERALEQDSGFREAAYGVAVLDLDDGKVIEVGRLGPGDFFGEMALLTGEPRGATIATITPSQIYEVRKEHIQPVIEQYPDIKQDLSQILTRRELENLRRRNEHFASIDEERNLASKLLSKITDFFGMSDRKASAAPKKKESADADD